MAETERSALATVEALLDAFNHQDAQAMGSLVSEGFELYYVDDQGRAGLASKGPEQLVRDMTHYFEANASVRSVAESVIDGPIFVSLRERIVGGASSIAVYEVRSGLIQRVWYFPAESASTE